MKVRLLSIAVALLTGLLAVFLLGLALGAPGTLAQEPEPCPRDFHWDQFSGQCCVQDEETLPAHGRIGYTGNSICDDGYAGDYEHRPTPSGEGPPGCPQYTSFAFLKECVKERTGGAELEPEFFASNAVYDGGSGAAPVDLATVGGIVGGGTLLIAGAGAIRVLRAPLSAMPAVAKLYEKRLAELKALREAEKKWRGETERLGKALVEAAREARRWESLLRFYRYQYWKRIIPISVFIAGSGFAAGALITLSAGTLAATAAWKIYAYKTIFGAGAGVTAQLTGGPSYPYEAAEWIRKIKDKVEQAEANVRRLEGELGRARDAKYSAIDNGYSVEKEVERLRTWR